MNRKQRRAGLKHASPGRPQDQSVAQLFADALHSQQQNKLDDAARTYKRLLLLKPNHAQASNNLACVLQAQGKFVEASARFARTLELMPQLLGQFSAICNTLITLLPPLNEARLRANEAWPERLPLYRLVDDVGLAAIAADPLLLTILQSTPVCDVALERVLTTLRAALLDGAGARDDAMLAFCCALAQQCFINEYIFAITPAEEVQTEQIKTNLYNISPMQLAVLAMYMPLHSLPDTQVLLDRTWPDEVNKVVTQQLREPMQERSLRPTIRQLTAIDDAVSLRVQRQYEANHYPRWVHIVGNVEPQTIDQYLRTIIPAGNFAPLGDRRVLDVLVAGCGTGAHPIELATKITNAQVLAIDLSLTSLAYAKRKTPSALAGRITYGQADILKLDVLERSFDVIDASGVLHHMANPMQGLRSLLRLLRADGLMHLGLYSEAARRQLTAARKYIAEKGYRAMLEDIRRARQDILTSNLRDVARASDFFSTSECRDLLFHVHEQQLTIPKIQSLLAQNGLTFIGFAFDPPRAMHYASLFAQNGKSSADLNAWHEFELHNPDTFSGMYQFWAQKK